MGRGFLVHSQNKGGIVGRPLPTKRESLISSFIPGHRLLLFIPGHQRPLVYLVHQYLPFIAGHPRFLVYTTGGTLFTPVARLWWALLGLVQRR